MSLCRLRDVDAVLLHIPNTGGTTIKRMFQVRDEQTMGVIPVAWVGLPILTMVRHPLDRFVSAVMFLRRMRWAGSNLRWHEALALAKGIPPDYNAGPIGKASYHLAPQTWHMTQAGGLRVYTGRFESFDDELRRIFREAEVPLDRPIFHSNATDHGDWRSEIPADLLPHVVAFYAQDLERFGYGGDR